MDLIFWISIGAIFLLLFLSGFFSGSETALTAVSEARMHTLEKDGDKRAALVNKIRERKERMIGALLLGNNLVNILASALATSVFIKLVGEAGVFYATLVMTILVLIFSEVLPKTYALYNSDNMARFIAPVIRVVVVVFSPVSEAVNSIVRQVLKLFGVDTARLPTDSNVEMLRGAIEMHRGRDREVQEQRAMLRSILDLANVEVGDIMVHRKNVAMIDAEQPVEDITDQILNSPYTRLPVFTGNPDNILGVVHAKWLVRELQANNMDMHDLNIQAVAAEPWFVPEATSLFDQLQAFRQRREHFAVVVDEYGTFMGIVTLEDILEEIVGDIDDEHDIPLAGVRKQAGGSYLVNGTVTIRDLNREFEWDLPSDDYATLAGLILYEAQQIPVAGQSFIFYGFRFDIVRKQRNQITLIRVTPPEDPEGEKGDSADTETGSTNLQPSSA